MIRASVVSPEILNRAGSSWNLKFRLYSCAIERDVLIVTTRNHPMLNDQQISDAIAKTLQELEQTRDSIRKKTLKVRLRFLRHAELVNAAKSWDNDAN